MNEQKLREIARQTVAGLDRLQLANGLSAEDASAAQASLDRTRAYWYWVAAGRPFQRPSWFAKLRKFLMDWRRYPFN